MSENHKTTLARRRFLKFVGGSAMVLPIVGLTGCSGGKDAAPPAAAPKGDTSPAQKDSTPDVKMDTPAEKPPTGGGMARLSEDDPQAKSLGYLHDAGKVDRSKQSRYQPGQTCKNCALYQAGDDAEWGNCSIFPGRQVKAAGWCNVYAPKTG